MKKMILMALMLAAGCAADGADDAVDPTPPEKWHVAMTHQGAIEGSCDAPQGLQWDVLYLDTDTPDVAQLEGETCGAVWRAHGYEQWRLDCTWQTFSIEIIVSDNGVGDVAYLRTGNDCIDFYDAEVETR
jgi:hypothetical protein